jgi:hypothetical protein
MEFTSAGKISANYSQANKEECELHAGISSKDIWRYLTTPMGTFKPCFVALRKGTLVFCTSVKMVCNVKFNLA